MGRSFFQKKLKSPLTAIATSIVATAITSFILLLSNDKGPSTSAWTLFIVSCIGSLFYIGYAGWSHFIMKIKEDIKRNVEESIKYNIHLEFEEFFEERLDQVLAGHFGVIKIFKNFQECENEILHAIKNSKEVKIFLQLGKKIAAHSSIYDYIEEERLLDNSNVKIMHCSKHSRYLSQEKALKRNSNRTSWIADADYAFEKIKILADSTKSNVEGREHFEGFYWRIFLFDNCGYIQPYLYKRNNSERSPVIKVSNEIIGESGNQKIDNSLYTLFETYFNNKWDEYKPKEYTLKSIINGDRVYAVASAIKINNSHLFCIPKRYLEANDNYIQFHGIGGKVNKNEDVFEALSREIHEEIKMDHRIETSNETYYYCDSDGLHNIKIADKTKPHSIYRRVKPTDPNFNSKDIQWLVGYHVEIDAESITSIKPNNELGVIISLTDDLLIESLDGQLTYEDIQKSSHGSIITSDKTNLDLKKLAIPHGLAFIIATTLKRKREHSSQGFIH